MFSTARKIARDLILPERTMAPRGEYFNPQKHTIHPSWAKRGQELSHMITNALKTLSAVPGFTRDGFNQMSELIRLQLRLQYPYTVNYLDLENLYERNPIAYRICNIFAQYTWTPAPIVLEADNDTGLPRTPFERACAEIAEKVNLFEYMERADLAAQIGQYGCLYIDYADTYTQAPPTLTDERNITETNPITGVRYEIPPAYLEGGLNEVNWESIEGGGADAINMVVPYEQPNAWPSTYIVNYKRPCFSLVEYYNLQSGGAVFGSSQSQNIIYSAALPVTWNVVHSSRVIHICDGNIGNNIIGVPKLQPIFNELMNEIRVSGGSALMYEYNGRGGLFLDVEQKENQSYDETQVAALKAAVADYLSGYSRVLVGDGVKAKEINFRIDNPAPLLDSYLKNIAAAHGIPMRMLFGNEAGHLASSTDQTNFYSTMKLRKERYATRKVKMFFDPLIAHKVIPEPKCGSYKVHYPILTIPDRAASAKIFNDTALGLAALANAKSTAVENAMDGFVQVANTLNEVKGDQADLNLPRKSYLSPDTRADDLQTVYKEDTPGAI